MVRAVIKAESNFDPLAISRAGAIGPIQLIP
ncbi:MAG: transglycosylase SLT domain-containing protein [Nitrospira sp.]|nr:transglycosylase SLT domain-containing protein [Nitrospira sp.]